MPEYAGFLQRTDAHAITDVPHRHDHRWVPNDLSRQHNRPDSAALPDLATLHFVPRLKPAKHAILTAGLLLPSRPLRNFHVNSQEKRYSTPFTFFDLIAQNFLVQFVVSVLSFISYEFGSGMAMSKGMWGVWMVYLWRLMLENPDAQIRVMCLPCTIPQKYYPLYILAFFTLISQSIDPVIFLAAGIGYVEAAFFKGYFFKYPLSFVKFT